MSASPCTVPLDYRSRVKNFRVREYDAARSLIGTYLLNLKFYAIIRSPSPRSLMKESAAFGGKNESGSAR